MKSTDVLKCTVCGNRLLLCDKVCSCGKHNFDISKEGYINLIPNGRKSSGDSKEMMESRRHFLSLGYYDVISNILNELVTDLSSPYNDYISLLDIGCGEGYYLNKLYECSNDAYPHRKNDFYGVDISKDAVKMASKYNKSINWVVCNSFSLPILSSSIYIAISLFSVLNFEELERVLVENGYAIVIRASEKHLYELKEIIYPEIFEQDKNLVIPNNSLFQQQKKNISYQIDLKNKEEIKSLLAMTPHYWRIKETDKEKLLSSNNLLLTVDIDIYIIQKRKLFTDIC